MVHFTVVEKDKATIEQPVHTEEVKVTGPAPHHGEGIKPAPKQANQVIPEAPHPGGT